MEHGKLRIRSARRCLISARRLTASLARVAEGFGVAEEPGLRDDHRFDQRLLLLGRMLQALPVLIGGSPGHGNDALAHGPLNDRGADGGHIQADALLEKIEKTLVVVHGVASRSSRFSGGAGNSSANGFIEQVIDPHPSSNPWASSRTGPRYPRLPVVQAIGFEIGRVTANGVGRLFQDQAQHLSRLLRVALIAHQHQSRTGPGLCALAKGQGAQVDHRHHCVPRQSKHPATQDGARAIGLRGRRGSTSTTSMACRA